METERHALLAAQLEFTVQTPAVYRFYLVRWPDGVEELLPSVSTILLVSGQIPARFMAGYEEARERGTAVAWATEAMDYGAHRPSDPEIALYADSYEQFLRESGCQVLDVERVVASRDPPYAGRCDRIVRLGNKELVLELKTGQPAGWHKVQVSAYAAAAGLGAGLLYLQPRRYRFVALSQNDIDVCMSRFATYAQTIRDSLRIRLVKGADQAPRTIGADVGG